MSGRIVSVPKAAHHCEGMPEAVGYAPGTVWECDECEQLWVVVSGAQYNETYYAWRKMTPANKDGWDR